MCPLLVDEFLEEGQLPAHGRRAADLAAQAGLVEDHLHPGAVLLENPLLPCQSQVDELPGLGGGLADLEEGGDVVGRLEMARDEARMVAADGVRRAFIAQVLAERPADDVVVRGPPGLALAAPGGLFQFRDDRGVLHAVLEQYRAQIRHGQADRARLDPDQLGQRPLKSFGRFTLRQPAIAEG